MTDIKFFLVIVTSFDPLYLYCNTITREQCKQYNVPVLFLFNGQLPDNYSLKEDERIFKTEPSDKSWPWMFLKFKQALKEIYSVSDPDYILRCNATTFINFKRVNDLLLRLPKEKCVAGLFLYATGFVNITTYCQGTHIIFSKDVAKRLANDMNENHPAVTTYADDIAIEILTRDYAYTIDISFFTRKYINFTSPPKLYDLMINCTDIFFRVKNNVHNRNEIDLEIWKLLHFLFDYIHYRNDYDKWGKNENYISIPE
jgi:hypothetical protein